MSSHHQSDENRFSYTKKIYDDEDDPDVGVAPSSGLWDIPSVRIRLRSLDSDLFIGSTQVGRMGAALLNAVLFTKDNLTVTGAIMERKCFGSNESINQVGFSSVHVQSRDSMIPSLVFCHSHFQS